MADVREIPYQGKDTVVDERKFVPVFHELLYIDDVQIRAHPYV